MSNYFYGFVRTTGDKFALAALILSVAAAAPAQSTDATTTSPAGRINFESANLPAANVEVDLSQEIFKDLFGIGDAAIVGIAEALISSSPGKSGSQVELAAEQLEAARQIIQLAGDVVREVRVRAFQGLPDGAENAQQLFKSFDEQLRAGKWDTLVRVRDGDQVVRVSVLRSNGSVQGIFVTAADGENVVLANAVCEVSPENVKKIASAATKIGLENGLADKIELKMKKPPARLPAAPVPPRSPAAPSVK